MLVDVNKLFVFKGESVQIESRLPFKIFPTLKLQLSSKNPQCWREINLSRKNWVLEILWLKLTWCVKRIDAMTRFTCMYLSLTFDNNNLIMFWHLLLLLLLNSSQYLNKYLPQFGAIFKIFPLGAWVPRPPPLFLTALKIRYPLYL